MKVRLLDKEGYYEKTPASNCKLENNDSVYLSRCALN